RESSLRRELDLELAAQELPLELLVLAHVRRRHPADAPGAEQQPEPPVIDAAVVADDREAARALLEKRRDQLHRIAAQPEAADRDGVAVTDVRDRVGCTADAFVDAHSGSTSPSVPALTLVARAPVLSTASRTIGARRRMPCSVSTIE